MSLKKVIQAMLCLFVIVFILPGTVQAQAASTSMSWVDFMAEYEALGESGGTIKMTSDIYISGEGALIRPEGAAPITVDADQYTIIVNGDNQLTIDDPALTFDKAQLGGGTLFSIGAPFVLNACSMRLQDSLAMMLGRPQWLDMSQASAVTITADYTAGYQIEAAIVSYDSDELRLRNLNLVTTNSQYGVSVLGSVSLEHCYIEAKGENALGAVQIQFVGTLNADETTTLLPEVVGEEEEYWHLQSLSAPAEAVWVPNGTAPDQIDFPTIQAYVKNSKTKEFETWQLPMEWDVSKLPNPLDTDAEQGTLYVVPGMLSEETMDAYNVRDTFDCSAQLMLQVYDPEPPVQIRATWKNSGSGAILLELSGIPEDENIQAIRLQFLNGQGSWETQVVAFDDYSTDDLLEVIDRYGLCAVRLHNQTGKLELRVWIEGSAMQGPSNEVTLDFGYNGVDSDSGGDRGGGGRDEPQRPEERPLPVETEPVEEVADTEEKTIQQDLIEPLQPDSDAYMTQPVAVVTQQQEPEMVESEDSGESELPDTADVNHPQADAAPPQNSSLNQQSDIEKSYESVAEHEVPKKTPWSTAVAAVLGLAACGGLTVGFLSFFRKVTIKK